MTKKETEGEGEVHKRQIKTRENNLQTNWIYANKGIWKTCGGQLVQMTRKKKKQQKDDQLNEVNDLGKISLLPLSICFISLPPREEVIFLAMSKAVWS